MGIVFFGGGGPLKHSSPRPAKYAQELSASLMAALTCPAGSVGLGCLLHAQDVSRHHWH